jgi:hemolysin activation/secretion protein
MQNCKYKAVGVSYKYRIVGVELQTWSYRCGTANVNVGYSHPLHLNYSHFLQLDCNYRLQRQALLINDFFFFKCVLHNASLSCNYIRDLDDFTGSRECILDTLQPRIDPRDPVGVSAACRHVRSADSI